MQNNHSTEDLDGAVPIIDGEIGNLECAEGVTNVGATSGDTFISNPSPHSSTDAEEGVTNTGVTSGDAFRNNPSSHSNQQYQLRTIDTDSSMLRSDSFQTVNNDVILPLERASVGCTRKKLLVLDVNGLLLDISSYVPYDYDPDTIISKKAIFKRPYCDDFLKFCFENFNVGVWSSRNKKNVESVLDFLLVNNKRKLQFCWDQSHCTYTDFMTVENREKPLLLKKLKRLWEKREPNLPWERGEYNESNTLLLDDSPYKAICNPPYTAIFPYTYRYRDRRDSSLGPGGDLRVYLEGLAQAENVQEYVKQNPFGQRPITERNLSWRFYLRVIDANSSPPQDTGDDV